MRPIGREKGETRRKKKKKKMARLGSPTSDAVASVDARARGMARRRRAIATCAALAIAAATRGVDAIDTGRRCCVYQIERPERDWDYNFRTTGVALLRGPEKIVGFDEDGYVSVWSYAGGSVLRVGHVSTIQRDGDAAGGAGDEVGGRGDEDDRGGMIRKRTRWR